MKKARKLTAVLLSLVMLLALVIPASAAENYSITIHNDKTGHTYEAYQIFAGTVSSDEETAGNEEGPMLGDITWGNNIGDPAALVRGLIDSGIEAFAGLNIDTSTAADVAEALEVAADAAAFADIVAPLLTGDPATSGDYDTATQTYTIAGLPAGYYLVKDKDGTLDGTADTATDYIVQVLGNVAMDPKDSGIPTLEKKVAERSKYQKNEGYGMYYNDVADWNIGDSVPFKLIASIPNNIESYDEYKFVFHDTLSNAFTLERDSIKVFVAEGTAATVEQFTPQDANLYQVAVEGQSFTLTIPDINRLNAYGNPANYVIVTYSATLNENAEIGLDGNENTAYLEFSNDPNGDGLGRTAEDTVIVFTYELAGTKVDGETQAALKNAQFVLLNRAKTEAAMVVDGKVKGWVKVATEAAADDVQMPETYEEWFTLNQQHNGLILTSDENGLFNIAGLDDGTYYLREIQAPAGYNLLEEDVKLDIAATTANGQTWNGNAADAFTALTIAVNDGEPQNGVRDTGIVNVTVENNGGATLPETGGMGTTLFYIIGGLLVVGAGILLVVRIRMKAHNE